jgi:hypothetical protein
VRKKPSIKSRLLASASLASQASISAVDRALVTLRSLQAFPLTPALAAFVQARVDELEAAKQGLSGQKDALQGPQERPLASVAQASAMARAARTKAAYASIDCLDAYRATAQALKSPVRLSPVYENATAPPGPNRFYLSNLAPPPG